MKEKFPKDSGEDLGGLEDVDALDAESVSEGPDDEDDSKLDRIDPETGLPLDEVSIAGLHVDDGESSEES